jgi:hypothetical protein
VTANTVSEVSGRGIVIEAWEGGTIKDVVVNGNTISTADSGVEVGVAAGGSVAAIDVSANTVTAARRGLVADLDDTGSGSEILFVNNLVTDVTDTALEATAPEDATEATLAVTFMNNTACGVSGTTDQIAGAAVIGGLSETSAVQVQNNIFSGFTRATIVIDDKVPAGVATIDTNLFTETTFGRAGETQGDNAVVTSDTVFTNVSAGDFTLAAGSPAVDAGLATDAPDADILGISRPQGSGVDIGAYEREP